MIVGRVEKDEVISACRSRGDPVFHGSFENRELVSQGVQILGEGFGGAMVVFEKKGGLGSPAESLEAVGAGAGKEIEHPRIGDQISQGGKDGGANAVLGGAEAGQVGDFETTAGVEASRDAKEAAAPSGMTRGVSFPIT